MFTLFLDIEFECEMTLQGSLIKMESIFPCQENHDGGLALPSWTCPVTWAP
jgi:hypothetical protein